MLNAHQPIKDKSAYYKLAKTQQPFNLFAFHFHNQDENNVKFSLPLRQSYSPNSKFLRTYRWMNWFFSDSLSRSSSELSE
jgi:hypothetical protein